MPVPQKMSFLVGWASCPPKKGLLILVQDVRCNILTQKTDVQNKIGAGFTGNIDR
ncbi:hypothetical protein QUB75_27345 [Microcoleus sp. K1-B6]|uniref:hypothetical protein n=1 Tax=Microcoleus sp. K1-B6 TaxID=2818787 RepID=UPI002FD82CAF